jgi:hypothetical protein
MGRERKRAKGAPTFVATFRIGFSPSQRRKASARFNAGTAGWLREGVAAQRKLDRQHRAGSPDCFDPKGRHTTIHVEKLSKVAAPRPAGNNLRVPAVCRLVPAAAGRAGGVA